MKLEIKILFSLIGAILFGVVVNAMTSGAKTTAHYQGIVMISILMFFVVMWLLSKISETEYVKEIQEKKEIGKSIQNNLENYQETKKTFKYFSDERLLKLYEEFQSGDIENLERLALEEELVERNLIKNSPMHEKLYFLKKKLME